MNALQIAFIAILVAAIWFTHSSLAADVYEKKGYNKTLGALMGLIPVYGLIDAFKKPGRRNVQKGTIKRLYRPGAIIAKLLLFVELCALSLIVVIPVVYMVGASFANTNELPTTFWPDQLTGKHYVELFTEYKFTSWYVNTLWVAILNMIIGVLCITGAGYVFSRFKFKGKKFGLITILVLQVFPSFMGMIAMYTLFDTFNLLGRPVALTILYVGGSIPGNLWLVKGYLSQIPRDLDESAMLDGANKLQIFTRIILPLSVPILSFVAVNQFMAPWMDYMLPSLLLKQPAPGAVAGPGETLNDVIERQYTLAVGLFEMISGTDKNSFTTFAAGALIVALPITVLYMVFQKFLIEGLTAGATKG